MNNYLGRVAKWVEQFDSRSDKNKNEKLKVGQLSTLFCGVHQLVSTNQTIIDTQGIGDTRGIQDKPNSGRLLSQLVKSAASNIVFCYANSRSSFYAPGEAHKKIRDMVSSLNLPDLKYEKENTFCFDSESFRVFSAHKQGIQFSDEQIKDFSNSWIKSVKSIEQLIS
ncbi:hypothetical protein ACTA71_005040 [Dictyostelium dimigraforme]